MNVFLRSEQKMIFMAIIPNNIVSRVFYLVYLTDILRFYIFIFQVYNVQ